MKNPLARSFRLALIASLAVFCIQADAEITAEQATASVVQWIGDHSYYKLPSSCLHAKNLGVVNAGYVVEVLASACPGRHDGEVIGRWRVDVKSGELFVQTKSGKFHVPRVKNAGGTRPVIREEQTLMVGGTREQWRLEWLHPPEPACSPEAEDEDGDWYTCPCAGFAYGEKGELDLVRRRPGVEEERMHLTPLFEMDEGSLAKAMLPRWPVSHIDSLEMDPSELSGIIRKRPEVNALNFGDYDHDGHATEFVLQVLAMACGHTQSVLLGIDSRNPRLHVLGTAEHSDSALMLEHLEDWQKLLDSQGDVTVVEFPCGDHGSETQDEIHLHTDSKGIHATSLVYECKDYSGKGKLKSKTVL